MADEKIRLRIVTPLRMLYDDFVDMVIIRGTEGDMGVLPGHEVRSTMLGYGVLKFRKDGQEAVLSVLGGFAEINKTAVTILSEAAEWPEDIDEVRALAAKERAEMRMKQHTENLDSKRAEHSLRRALVRIEVSTYPIIKDSLTK